MAPALVEKVREMVRESEELAKKWEDYVFELSEEEQAIFNEIYLVMTMEPLSSEEIDDMIQDRDWYSLDLNTELLKLQEKWPEYV